MSAPRGELGLFQHRYQGALVDYNALGQHAFYRYYVPDPVYFEQGARVTLQQMGNDTKEAVLKMIARGVRPNKITLTKCPRNRGKPRLTPVIVDHGGTQKFRLLLDGTNSPDLTQDPVPGGYVCYLRRDDVSAVSFFYLDSPTSNLPEIAPAEKRAEGIPEKIPPATK